jgi:hypothetical protein
MEKEAAVHTAEMIAVRLRKELDAEGASGPIWQALFRLSHAEMDRRPWPPAVRPRHPDAGANRR